MVNRLLKGARWGGLVGLALLVPGGIVVAVLALLGGYSEGFTPGDVVLLPLFLAGPVAGGSIIAALAPPAPARVRSYLAGYGAALVALVVWAPILLRFAGDMTFGAWVFLASIMAVPFGGLMGHHIHKHRREEVELRAMVAREQRLFGVERH